MFDCNSFLNRKGWKQRELAQRLNIGTSTVGMWCTGKSTPSYDVILQLINLGMTTYELFGKDISDMLQKNSEIDPDVASTIFDSPEFRATVEKILVDIQSSSKKPDFSDSNNLLDQRIKGNSPTGNI